MGGGVGGTAGVVDNKGAVAEVGGLPGGALDGEVGGDPGEQQGVDAAAAEQGVQQAAVNPPTRLWVRTRSVS